MILAISCQSAKENDFRTSYYPTKENSVDYCGKIKTIRINSKYWDGDRLTINDSSIYNIDSTGNLLSLNQLDLLTSTERLTEFYYRDNKLSKYITNGTDSIHFEYNSDKTEIEKKSFFQGTHSRSTIFRFSTNGLLKERIEKNDFVKNDNETVFYSYSKGILSEKSKKRKGDFFAKTTWIYKNVDACPKTIDDLSEFVSDKPVDILYKGMVVGETTKYGIKLNKYDNYGNLIQTDSKVGDKIDLFRYELELDKHGNYLNQLVYKNDELIKEKKLEIDYWE